MKGGAAPRFPTPGIPLLTLLYDASCATCGGLAQDLRQVSDAGVEIAGLGSDRARQLLPDQDPSEPTLVETRSGAPPRTWTGWAMARRLAPELGMRGSLRIVQAMHRAGVRPTMEGPASGGISRRALLRGATTGAASLVLVGAGSRVASAAGSIAAPVDGAPDVAFEELSRGGARSALARLQRTGDLDQAKAWLANRGFTSSGSPVGVRFTPGSPGGEAVPELTLVRLPVTADGGGEEAVIDVRLGSWDDGAAPVGETVVAAAPAGGARGAEHALAAVDRGQAVETGTSLRAATGQLLLEPTIGDRASLVVDAPGTSDGLAASSTQASSIPGNCQLCNVLTSMITSFGCGVLSHSLLTGACAGTGPAFPVCAATANGIFLALCAAFGASVPIAACGQLGYC